MRRESSWFVNSALIGIVAVGVWLPVLLILTTSWPIAFVAAADILAVIGLWCLYGTGFQAGYRARDEIGSQSVLDAVLDAANYDHPEGI